MLFCCYGNRVTTFGKKWSRIHSFTLFIFFLLNFPLSLISFTIGAADSTIDYSVKAPLAPDSLLLDGVYVEGRTVVVGERGHILISDDDGQSWNQATVPTQNTLTAVHFHDKNTGWAVGHDAIILRTEDGGKDWERVYYAPELECPLLDIIFLNATDGIAVGAYGLFLVTADGGDTWAQQQISDDDFHLNHIAQSGTGELFIASEAGRIYRSSNDGSTWIELPSPYRGSFFGTLPLANNALLAFGLRGHMYRSRDSGQTWELVEDVDYRHAHRRCFSY